MVNCVAATFTASTDRQTMLIILLPSINRCVKWVPAVVNLVLPVNCVAATDAAQNASLLRLPVGVRNPANVRRLPSTSPTTGNSSASTAAPRIDLAQVV